MPASRQPARLPFSRHCHADIAITPAFAMTGHYVRRHYASCIMNRLAILLSHFLSHYASHATYYFADSYADDISLFAIDYAITPLPLADAIGFS